MKGPEEIEGIENIDPVDIAVEDMYCLVQPWSSVEGRHWSKHEGKRLSDSDILFHFLNPLYDRITRVDDTPRGGRTVSSSIRTDTGLAVEAADSC